MQHENVLEVLNRSYATSTKSGRKIIDYIQANSNEVQFLSIAGLAEVCRVGDATISRFCKSLGYNGYNELKMALAKACSTNHPQSITPMDEAQAIQPEDTVTQMAKKLYANNAAAMAETLSRLNDETLQLAVQFLYSAQRVYCFGQGASGIVAKDAWLRFTTVSPYFEYIEDSHIQAMATSMCSFRDTILFFTYSGATKDMLDVLRPAKENGAKIILVTRHNKSPATAFADVVLLCGSREGPMQTGSISAKIAQLFLVDVLVNEYCRQNEQFTSANREATANAITAKLL